MALAGCGGGSASPATVSTPAPKVATAGAPVLSASHPGTRNPRCEQCHRLPVAGHTATQASQCAACHGANGACSPNGRPTVRGHSPSDDCTSCHPAHHGFALNSECAACHFAAQGTRICGGAAPSLSGALSSGCHGWPDTEFSPSNSASVRTFLAPGDRAVDFTLRDVNGATVGLSSLLATRPVLLVHGSFT